MSPQHQHVPFTPHSCQPSMLRQPRTTLWRITPRTSQSWTPEQHTASFLLPVGGRGVIHLKVATGTTVRALLYNNVKYAKSVTRPLISVGQLKGMLDLRMIWDDSSPLIVVCYAGKKYVLLQANVVHHLPLVSKKELRAILTAIHDFTVRGELWSIHKWSAALNKTLDEFFWTNPDWSPPGCLHHLRRGHNPSNL